MKIALVAPDDFSVWQFRKGLIQYLVSHGHEVYVISDIFCLTTPPRYFELLKEIGVTYISIKINRFFAPRSDIGLIINLYKIFKKISFDIVHNFTIKPNIFGSIAAKFANVPKIICSVTGRGFVKFNKILNLIVKIFYWYSFRISNKIWFQNPDDLNYFLDSKIVDKNKAVLIKGSGVNLDEFSINSLNEYELLEFKKKMQIDSSSKIITMVVARVVKAKGVIEFIKASEILKDKYPIKFILVGPIEKNSSQSIQKEYLKKKEELGNFKWISFVKDIRKIYAISDVVVLPSYYGEGVPRSLLEAMAMEKPIITTDNVGCREVVEDGKNGYLVPIKDSKALANAIEKLIIDENKRKKFGRYSRIKVEKEFDEKIVIERIIKELYQLDY